MVVAVSPTSRSSNSPLASKVMSPLESIVISPPLLPAIGIPTSPATPLISETIKSSPSGSLSAPLPLSAKTLPIAAVSFSEAVMLSSTASGAGFVTVSSNVSVMVPPSPSSAVTVIVYTPSLFGPPCEAELSSVPVISPVAGSIINPAGRPVPL